MRTYPPSSEYAPPRGDLHTLQGSFPLQSTGDYTWMGPAGGSSLLRRSGHPLLAQTINNDSSYHMTYRALDAWRTTQAPAPAAPRRGAQVGYDIRVQDRTGGVRPVVPGRAGGPSRYLNAGADVWSFEQSRFSNHDARLTPRADPSIYMHRPPAPNRTTSMQLGHLESYAQPCRRVQPDVEMDIDHGNLLPYMSNPYTPPLPRVDGQGWGGF